MSTACAVRSCSLPVSAAEGKQITTIEGLAQGGVLHKVQKAWIDHDVPQCGYCQCGMIMAVAALLKDKPKPTDADIDADDHQHLPLRHLPAGARGDPRRREAREREAAMNYVPKMNRRTLRRDARPPPAAGSRSASTSRSAVRSRSCAQDGSPEINAWVVIKPDDTVVIRIARSEMGQGTLTGLAQLVAEELECDWSKVTWEYPDARPERRAQARLGRLRHRRQPRHPPVARICAQGRRHRARDADPGRRQRVEGAGRPSAAAANSVITHTAVRPHHHLRQGRRCGRQARAAEGGRSSRTRRTGRSPASRSSGSTPPTR